MSGLAWTTLEARQVVKDRWLDLVAERCRTPSGAEVEDYYVLRCPDWVNAVAVTPQGRFVRTRQWRQGARAVSLEFAGGVSDPGEAPEEAAARELLEETGYGGAPGVSLGWVWANPASHSNRVHTVLITDARLIQAPLADGIEVLEVEEADAATVLDDIRDGRMTHPLHVAAAFAVLLHRPKLMGPELMSRP